MIWKRENDIVRPQNKIFINCLYKMKAEIMPDPSVEYLENFKFTPTARFFPTSFTYQYYKLLFETNK